MPLSYTLRSLQRKRVKESNIYRNATHPKKTKFGDDFQELNKTMIKDCVHEHLQLYSSAATL